MEKRSCEFQIFAKPAGSACNLGCRYCYYLDKKSLYPGINHFLMPDDILERYIKQHIKATTESIIGFSWHGGEPLLAGIGFYKKAIRLQMVNKPAGKTIVNGIQTNGTLIDDEWCRFFAGEGFVVGMSIDGPADLHNKFRRTKDDRSTWAQVNRGFHLLKKHGIIPEILCVVSAENVKHPRSVYDEFKKMGAKYITFLPLVEPDPGSSIWSK